MIIYFTGTGNSRLAAEVLAKELQDDVVNAGALMKAGEKGAFTSDKPYVLVSPIYSWRMPAVYEKFLRNSDFIGNKKAYFVMTCGGDMGAAGAYNEKLCQEIGLEYFGSLEVVMPDNYILMFPAPGPEEAKQIVKKAVPVLHKGAEHIRIGAHFPEKKCGAADKVKSGIINTGFNKYFVKAKEFRVTEQCFNCGKCVDACVLNNVSLVDGKPVWGGVCTQCMACICGCPKEAIEYGKKTVGKVRYQCPKEVEQLL